MRVSVVGSGYVGTTVAACFAELGHRVVNVDIDESVVAAINDGEAPIHEPGLDALVEEHAPGGTGRLRATTGYDAVLDTEVTFLCLPTPSNADGSIDLSFVETGARSFSGMGTPDLLGTQGVVSVFTEGPPEKPGDFGGKGEVEVVSVD